MIKLLILDVDGVMTDGKKYYDRDGTVRLKTFCDKDWTAIKRFRALGINVMFLTGDGYNVEIANNRNIDVIVTRNKEKADYLPEICKDYGVVNSEIIFVGDDIFDIGLMKLVKSYCPKDAPLIVKDYAQTLNISGGDNFVMQLFDYLSVKELPKFDFDEHLKKVYELDMKEKF
jgi:3-deoxy-D-manno-octulosonate 8-phosphate phosphatase (KDO 8-P phosphatase)